MNEIEETLLMIFLEERNLLDEESFEQASCNNNMWWDIFKQLEIGRTLPEEYEFYVDDYELSYIKKNKSSCICLEDSWSDGCKNKITITIN